MKTRTTTSDWMRGNVLGLVAIFMALSGTAYATHPGGANTISTDDIIDGEVRQPDIQNGAVTTADISNSNGVRSEDVVDDTLAGGGLSAVDLGPDSVAASEVSDESLGSAELAPNSVAASEVSDESLGSADLGNDAAGTTELQDLGVTTEKLADGAVTGTKLGLFAVSSTRIAPNAVTGTKINDNAVSSDEVLDNSLTGSDIGAGAVGSSEVATGSLGTAEFASSIPAVHVTRANASGDQGVNNNTSTTLNFNSERYDTAGMHSNTTNISRLTAPVAGIYAVNVSLLWDSQGAFPSGERRATLFKNGTTEVGFDKRDADTAPSGAVTVNLTAMLRLAAGDFIEARVLQDSGGTRSIRNLGGESSPEFSMTWLAPGPP